MSALTTLREVHPDATEQDICSASLDSMWPAHGYLRVLNEVETPCGICASSIAKIACGRCDGCAKVVCLSCMKEYDTANDGLASPQYYLPWMSLAFRFAMFISKSHLILMYVLMCRFAALDGVNLSLKLWSNQIKSSRNYLQMTRKWRGRWGPSLIF